MAERYIPKGAAAALIEQCNQRALERVREELVPALASMLESNLPAAHVQAAWDAAVDRIFTEESVRFGLELAQLEVEGSA